MTFSLARSLVLVALGCTAALAGAQAKTGLSKAPPKAPVVVTNAPVSRAEARVVFARVGKAMRPLMKADAGKMAIADKPGAVSRAEVIAELARLFAASRNQIKLTPRRVSYSASVLSVSDAKSRKELETLVAWGLVARVGPLATSKAATLTPTEFGDAVGFFIARMAEITHLPSTKYTPALMSDG